MRRWIWGGALLVAASAFGAGYYVLFSPKIATATAAEIDAALPKSLRVKDAPSADSDARYRELLKLASRLTESPRRFPDLQANRMVLAEIEALLNHGPLQVPHRPGATDYPEISKLKIIAKVISSAAWEAQERHDQTACGRWAVLGLRYGNAISEAGGVVIDQLIAIAIDAIVVRAAYLAEMEGGLDAKTRTALLTLLPPQDGSSMALADAVRRDFQMNWMPILLNPKAHAEGLIDIGMDPNDDVNSAKKPTLAGTFDPVASAKLAGGVYDALISDLRNPPAKQVHAETAMVRKAIVGLPSGVNLQGMDALMYRIRMNIGENTLGRVGVVNGALTALTEAPIRAATNRNLVRAVLLLRSGQTPAVFDPLSGGNLQFDRARKIVWSVGKNGRDDGGNIGDGYEAAAPDLGYPYGDRAWSKLHPQVIRPAVPAGSPPPGFGAAIAK